MRVRVEVTRDDIDRGVRRNAKKCPVARAVRRQLIRGCRVFVTGTLIISKGTSVLYEKPIELPQQASRFIAKFDETRMKADRKKLKPFVAILDIPEKYL
jgi:hypothetical protein